jgi:hypothetical protein
LRILRFSGGQQGTCIAKRLCQRAGAINFSIIAGLSVEGQENVTRKPHDIESVQVRHVCATRPVKLVETTAEDFLTIPSGGKVSVVHYLKRLHNLAVGLGWLAFPVLAPRLWPKLRFKSKRGITLAEHRRILAAEKNPERNLFYQLLWESSADMGRYFGSTPACIRSATQIQQPPVL